MSDYRINVGINEEYSLKNMASSLQSLFATLNKTTWLVNVDIGASKSSLKGLLADMNKLQGEMSSLNSKPLSITSGAYVKGIVGDIDSIIQQSIKAKRSIQGIFNIKPPHALIDVNSLLPTESFKKTAYRDVFKNINTGSSVKDLGSLNNAIDGAIFKFKELQKVQTQTAKNNAAGYMDRINATNRSINSDLGKVEKGLGGEDPYGTKAQKLSALTAEVERYKVAMAEFKNTPVQEVTQTQIAAIQEKGAALKELIQTELRAQQQEASYSSAVISATNNPKEYATVIRTLNAEIQRATTMQHNYSAARTGKAPEAYGQIEGTKENLVQMLNMAQGGTLTREFLDANLPQQTKNLGEIRNAIKLAGEDTRKFGERVGGLAKKFSTWFGITRVIMGVYRTIRKMISSVTELDTAMTELRKVTDETESTYAKFLENAKSRSQLTGASLVDTVSASADFARLGYSLEDSEQLADAAIIYKNVGDGIQDINESSESIIATMQAFGVAPDSVMNIVDKFNEVGNNFAISSKGVGDALLRSAAALHAANNSIDESIALAAGANTIVQDPEKVGKVMPNNTVMY